MPSLLTVTLGCKVNQYETQWVRQGLHQLGYRDVCRGEPVDLCVINTCVVTAEAEAKSRKLIRRIHRDHPQAEIVVIGCFAAQAAELVARLPGVVEVVGDKRRLPDWLARMGLIEPPKGLERFVSRHRAYIKVQDGCRMTCSYCIIPKVRPYLHSRPIDEVVAEIARLVSAGHREIVLTGIHLGHYGRNDPPSIEPGRAGGNEEGVNLVSLLRHIAHLPGTFRVRLSSLEATEADDELLDVLGSMPDRFCPHLHLALQSGSNRILRAMRRPWPVEKVLERCRAARDALADPALTTDAIVGFPGETEEDFAATCEAVRAAGFSKIHVFRFSPRKGTEAAELPNAVDPEIKYERAKRLEALALQLREEFCRRQLGQTVEVLIEATSRDDAHRVLGTSERYLEASMTGRLDEVGGLRKMKVLGVAGTVLYDRPAPLTTKPT